MRKAFCVALMLAVGCDEPRTENATGSPVAVSVIGTQVIVKPGKNSDKPNEIMLVLGDIGSSFEPPMFVESFRAVVLEDLPEVYFKGKLDDGARWRVKIEDGPAKGRTANVYKNRVDLVPIK